MGGVVDRAGRWSHLAPQLKQRAWGGVAALEWATSIGAWAYAPNRPQQVRRRGLVGLG